MLFKFLLIIGITIYIIYKAGSFLFKIGAASQQFRNNQSGNIPGNDPRKNKKRPNITGEYVDYEDVK